MAIPCNCAGCLNNAPVPKKKIAIIGSGASGLTVMKELTALGHEVSCYECLPVIGGVYAKSYDHTTLTTSSCLTAYSDYSDGLEHRPKFWSDTEYLAYLDGFANKFNLRQYINFRTKVEKVQRCPKAGKWTVSFKRNRYSPPHRAYPAVEAENEEEPMEEESGFDGVCICTGTNTWASLPCFKGQDKFKGEIMHSEKYRSAEEFKGKRVLVVGSGESGSDICNEISKYASSTGLAIRGKHGHLIPRKQADGRVTDLNTNRCRYSNPYVLGDWVGYVNQLAKRFVASMGPADEEAMVLKKIAELNLGQNTSAFSKFGCKNAGFVEAMVLRGTSLHRGGFELTETKAIFGDGSTFECDVIVACTGYKNTFPFVEETHPDINEYGQNPRLLYKQIFHPNYNGEIAYFGFARPAFGSIPPTSEMQSRFYSMVMNGDLKLPCRGKMVEVALEDKAQYDWRFGYDAKRVKGLVDFQIYTDDLAKEMGVLPPLMKIFFQKPKLWMSIMFGPFTMHQYRLQGPYANPAIAAEVYERQPKGDFLECSITAAFLGASKILSILGFKQFKPNNF
eukprot:jgi/Undpi1/11365/HiC_scaffold_30.g13662.m1